MRNCNFLISKCICIKMVTFVSVLFFSLSLSSTMLIILFRILKLLSLVTSHSLTSFIKKETRAPAHVLLLQYFRSARNCEVKDSPRLCDMMLSQRDGETYREQWNQDDKMEMIDSPTDTSHLFNAEILGLQLYLECLVAVIIHLLSPSRTIGSIFDRS